MNEELVFQQACDRARGEPVPTFDVSGRVLRQIRETRTASNGPLALFAAISAAAAMIVLVYAADVWSTWQDPIAGLLCSAETVLQ